MNTENKNILPLCLILFLFLFGSAIIIMASVPPVDRDALTHHLAIPKLYLQHGGVYEIPELNFSYYPMTLDLLYMVPLALGNDIAPKYIHFAFALLTAFLIYRYLKPRISRSAALLGCLLFLTTPIITKLSTTAYVDLGLVFFTTASLLLVFCWQENEFKSRFLVLAAFACGLAIATKYLGLISLMLLAAIVPVLYGRGMNHKIATKWILGSSLLFIAIALLTVSPWLVRNYLWTGNPLYPLFDSLFNKETAAASTATTIDIFSQRKILFNESTMQIVLLPLRIFLEGQDNNPQYFDGRLNPFFLILPLLGLFTPNRTPLIHHEKLSMALFSILFLFFVLFQHGMRIRYIASIVPCLTILSVYGLKNIVDFAQNRKAALKYTLLAGVVIIASLMMGYNTFYIYNLFKYIAPLDYHLKKIDTDAYITAHVPEYPVVQYSNRNIPSEEKVLCLFLGYRGYYMNFKHVFDLPTSKQSLIRQVAFSSPDLTAALKEKNLTYILMRNDLTASWINSLDENSREKITKLFQNGTKLLYDQNGYSLHAVL